MFQKLRLGFYRPPTHARLRLVWIFLSIVFIIQGIFYWQTEPLIRMGVWFIGVAYIALVVAETLPEKQIRIAM